MEELIEHRAWHLFQKAYGVDMRAFFTCTNRIRASLPDEVKKATQVAKERERIVGDARAQAQRIIQEAQERAQALVAEDAITRDAQAQAQQMIVDARREAAEIKSEAKVYAHRVFANLESYGNKVMEAVRQGKHELESALSGEPTDQQPGA